MTACASYRALDQEKFALVEVTTTAERPSECPVEMGCRFVMETVTKHPTPE